MASALRRLHFRPDNAPPSSPPSIVAVDERFGVDLSSVGRAVGIEPATARLNGYFLSRNGPSHVSSFTWRSLLSFFASRGLPAGGSCHNAIVVQGKPSREHVGKAKFASKTEFEELERPLKKIRISDDRCAAAGLTVDDILSVKRRLKLDDSGPQKKMKLDLCHHRAQLSCGPKVEHANVSTPKKKRMFKNKDNVSSIVHHNGLMWHSEPCKEK